jgi:hypothetical protein
VPLWWRWPRWVLARSSGPVWSLYHQPPHIVWYMLAGLALLNGPLSIRMPSVRATISVSEGIVFTSALLLGPAAATAIAAIDGLAVSLWSRKRSALQTFFGICEPALSVCLASVLFYRLAGVDPLLHHAAPFLPLLGPVLAFTSVYFSLNTLLAGTAVLAGYRSVAAHLVAPAAAESRTGCERQPFPLCHGHSNQRKPRAFGIRRADSHAPCRLHLIASHCESPRGHQSASPRASPPV